VVSLVINGQTLHVPEYFTVLQAAEKAGITIPTLCHHRDLTPYGGCRLCVVEIQGARLPATSCTMPVSPGMVVQTESQALTRYRRSILELLLSDFYDAGYTRQNGTTGLATDTQFAYWVKYYGIDMKTAMMKKPSYPIDSDPNPYVWVDMNKCILCTRCVRACGEIQGRFVWSQAYRGYKTHIVAGANATMLQSRCESCGACAVYCPTGALDHKLSISQVKPDRNVTTVCSYCSVGCQLVLNVKDDIPGGRIISVTSTPNAPVNGLHLCVKGRYGYEFIQNSKRHLHPRVRKYLLDGVSKPPHKDPWVEVDWETALKIVADRLMKCQGSFGPDSIGFLASGKVLNEEVFLFNKFARQVIGTNNINLGARIYQSSTVSGLSSAVGLRSQPNLLDNVIGQAESMLIIGSNTTEQNPVFGAKLRQAVLRRSVKLVVAHPDFVNIAEYAALRLTYRPGSAPVLLNGLMKIILDHGWENREFINKQTEGLENLRKTLIEYPPAFVESKTGVPSEDLMKAAGLLVRNSPSAVIWAEDLIRDYNGDVSTTALINLQLLLGNIGIPGGGVVPLRSQCNSQGASDLGCVPNEFSGYQWVERSEVREKFRAAWGAEMPAKPGVSATDLLSAVTNGQLKALYIMQDDIVGGSGNNTKTKQVLEKCEFVILQECMPSETTQYADVILPGVSFAEKTGTFTSTERRIQMVREAIAPRGDSRRDWEILIRLATLILEKRQPLTGSHSGCDYKDTSQIMAEAAFLTPIYAEVSHEKIEASGSIFWPVDESSLAEINKAQHSPMGDRIYKFIA
jgi:predicted molibdopterin-dependent oxidoreductase YjgC